MSRKSPLKIFRIIVLFKDGQGYPEAQRGKRICPRLHSRGLSAPTQTPSLGPPALGECEEVAPPLSTCTCRPAGDRDDTHRGAGLDLRDRAPLLPGARRLSPTAGGRSSLQPSDHRGCWFWECTRWPPYPAVPGSGRCDRAYLAGVRVQRPRDPGSRKPPAPALRPRMPRWPFVSPRRADTPLP